MAGESLVEFPGSELAAPVGAVDAAVDVTAADGSVVERGDGEAGLHPSVDGVADDPVREQVLDGAPVELALGGAVLGDVGEPDLVRSLRGEVSTGQVVAGRGAGLGGLAILRFGEAGPPAVVPTDPHTVRSHTSWPTSRVSSARNR